MYDENRNTVGPVVEMESITTPTRSTDIATTPNAKENLWIRFWSSIRWFPDHMPSSGKLLVLKLDLGIIIFGAFHSLPSIWISKVSPMLT